MQTNKEKRLFYACRYSRTGYWFYKIYSPQFQRSGDTKICVGRNISYCYKKTLLKEKKGTLYGSEMSNSKLQNSIVTHAKISTDFK